MVLPFGGSASEREGALARLARIELGEGDESFLVDNRAIPAPGVEGAIRIIPASSERSSYYARNVGAEAATAAWLLFIDADCEPPADLIGRYFAEQPGSECGIVAGGVDAAREQTSLVARYARARGHIDERWHVEREPLPAGVTANLLVLREAWESLGGFHEGVRSGEDVEFCWRVQEAGWGFEHRPEARVRHLHPERLRPMLHKTARHAAGRLWVNRRYPGAYERPRLLRPLIRSFGGAVVWSLRGRGEQAAFKLLDGAWHWADARGWYLGDNRAAARPRDATPDAGSERRVLYMTDAAPARSETFIYSEAAALARRGWSVRFEASARAARSERRLARTLPLTYLEDDPPLEKLRSLLWLLVRHPLRCLADRRTCAALEGTEPSWALAALAPAARRLVRSGDAHIHAHFGALASQHALRLAALSGRPFSVALHGYDVYQRPANLEVKLTRASFAAAACESMSRDLARLVTPEHAARIAVVPMGVDPERFKPSADIPGASADGTVIAVGRLVPKKGFTHLLAAAEQLRREGIVERVLIVGAGPLEAELRSEIAARDLEGVVQIVEAWGAEPVRELLASSAVMAVPAVIAPDGDRDSMPVVAKEALAMQVPVVASDLVGLPEMIRPQWGRLVPPGDATALAGALGELLRMPAVERQRLGVAGRAYVSEELSTARQAERLALLLERGTSS